MEFLQLKLERTMLELGLLSGGKMEQVFRIDMILILCLLHEDLDS